MITLIFLKEIHVIYNFVDIKRFHRYNKEHFKRMIAREGEKLIVHTSNFRKVKRVGDVVEIFSHIIRELPAKLLMVGDGPERRKAEELGRELGIFEDIVFLGSQDSVEEIYSIADLFLLPSESESFGLAALEAMSCGVPVVASNTGGIPEMVVDGVTGFTSDVGDINKMAHDALSLLRNETRWAEFSKNALGHAGKFTIDSVVPAYEALYEEVLQRVPSSV